MPDSVIHVTWGRDPGDLAFYRQQNDLDPGESFTVMSNGNDSNAEGTISFSTNAGAQVSLIFQSEEGRGFGATVPCFFGGIAFGGGAARRDSLRVC